MNNDVFLLSRTNIMLKKIYSLEEQYQLIDISPANVQLILNPYREILEESVQKDPSIIQFIYFPVGKAATKSDEELQLLAVRTSGYAIKLLKGASLSVRYAAINKNGDAIEYVAYPTEEEQLLAIKDDPLYIKYIKCPTIKVQLTAIRADIACCLKINEASLEAQILAYKICQNEYLSGDDERYLYQDLDEHPDIEIYRDIIYYKKYNTKYTHQHHSHYELVLKLCPEYFERIEFLPGILQQLNRIDPPVFNFADFDIEFRYSTV